MAEEVVAWAYETRHLEFDDTWDRMVTFQHPEKKWGSNPLIEYRDARPLFTADQDDMALIQMRVDRVPVMTAAMEPNQRAEAEIGGKAVELYRAGDSSEELEEWLDENQPQA